MPAAKTETATASAWSLAGRALSAAILVLPPIAVYAPKAVVPLAVAVAAVLVLDRPTRAALAVSRPPLAVTAFLLLAAWSLVSVAWTSRPAASLALLVSLLGLLLGAWILGTAAGVIAAGERDRLAAAAALAGCLLVAVLGFEIWSGGYGLRILKRPLSVGGDDHLPYMNPGVAILAVSAWPFAAGAARRFGRAAAAFMLGAVFVVLASAQFSTPLLALAGSVPVFALAWTAPRWGPVAMSLVLALAAALFPFAFRLLFVFQDLLESHGIAPTSVRHRQVIWEFVAARIADHPILGWGLDSSRHIPGAQDPFPGRPDYSEMLPLHPHNAFLQVWLELGAVGAALLVLVIVAIPLAMRQARRDRLAVAVLMATVFAYVGLALLSFGMWQNWWLATLALAVTFALAVTGGEPRRPPASPA